jgi:hypothetical protein
MKIVKKTAVNILATTAITLIVLSIVALIMNADCLYLHTVIECFAANLLIHAGLFFVRRIESHYLILDLTFEMVYILLVLIIFGFIFGWYSSTPLWMVVCIGAVVYFISVVISVTNTNKALEDINSKLLGLKAAE